MIDDDFLTSLVNGPTLNDCLQSIKQGETAECSHGKEPMHSSKGCAASGDEDDGDDSASAASSCSDANSERFGFCEDPIFEEDPLQLLKRSSQKRAASSGVADDGSDYSTYSSFQIPPSALISSEAIASVCNEEMDVSFALSWMLEFMDGHLNGRSGKCAPEISTGPPKPSCATHLAPIHDSHVVHHLYPFWCPEDTQLGSSETLLSMRGRNFPTRLLNISLHPHQLRTVRWMYAREHGGASTSKECPVRHFLYTVRGGILADEAGLGKSITTLSLCEWRYEERSVQRTYLRDQIFHGRVRSHATLIVCPNPLLMQWKSEILRHVQRECKVLVYKGKNTISAVRSIFALASDYDYVLTTYQTVYRDALVKENLGSVEVSSTHVGHEKEIPVTTSTVRKPRKAVGTKKGPPSRRAANKKPMRQEEAEGNGNSFESTTLYLQNDALALASDLGKEPPLCSISKLTSIHWDRIVFDDPQTISTHHNGSHNTTEDKWKAIDRLHADFRWCLSAFPQQQRIYDVFLYLRLIGVPRLQASVLLQTRDFHRSMRKEEVMDQMDTIGNLPMSPALPDAFPEDVQNKNLQEACTIISPFLGLMFKQVICRTPRSSPGVIPVELVESRIQISLNIDEQAFHDMLYVLTLTTIEDKMEASNEIAVTASLRLQLFELLLRMRRVALDSQLVVEELSKESEKLHCRNERKKRLREEQQESQLRLEVERKDPEIRAFIRRLQQRGGKQLKQAGDHFTQVMDAVRNGALTSQECFICFDDLKDPHFLPCAHYLCQSCVTKILQRSSLCPLCKRKFSKKDVLIPPILPSAGKKESASAQTCLTPSRGIKEGILRSIGDFLKDKTVDNRWPDPVSSKTRRVCEDVECLLAENPTARVVLCSQFTEYLQSVHQRLQEYSTLQGDVSLLHTGTLSAHTIKLLTNNTNRKPQSLTLQKRRGHTEGNELPSCRVILLNSNALNLSGLSLTWVSHCFILEPSWSSQIETSLIERIHRVGQQHSSVTVVRYVTQGTIEERMFSQNEKHRKSMARLCMDGQLRELREALLE